MQLKHLLKVKTNLAVLLGPQLRLLSKGIGALLEELEKEEKENNYVLHFSGKGLRSFFYEERPLAEPSAKQQFWESILNQLKVELDEFEFEIAQTILENLDDRGFFIGSEEDIAKSFNVHREVVEDIREFIMTEIEPVGIASRDYREFILVQVKEIYPEKQELVEKLIEYFRTGKKDEEIKKLLSSLRLIPFDYGEVIYKGGSLDIIIEKDKDDWFIFLADDFIEFAVDEKKLPNTEEEKEKRNRALRIKAILEMRRRILMRSAQLLIERQEEFLLGKGPLKALTLGELAQGLDVSLSTVSRVVSNKYVKTPTGIYPLRFFFQRRTKDGYSKEEILRAIKDILAEEEKLSDAKICERLKERGINIARRTVCKYRKMLERK